MRLLSWIGLGLFVGAFWLPFVWAEVLVLLQFPAAVSRVVVGLAAVLAFAGFWLVLGVVPFWKLLFVPVFVFAGTWSRFGSIVAVAGLNLLFYFICLL